MIPAPTGREIKAVLALHGLRVEDIAAAAELSRPTLYRMLSGERAMSDDELARVLAAIDATAAPDEAVA